MRVYGWIFGQARRYLNWLSIGAHPSAAVLSDVLWDLASEQGSEWIASDYDLQRDRKLDRIIDSKLAGMCDRAAAEALDTHDPEWKRKRAANGGKKSRRGNSFTVQMLASVQHLDTPEEMAKAMGCSVRTYWRRVKDLENQVTCHTSTEPTSAELTAYIANVAREETPLSRTYAPTPEETAESAELAELLAGGMRLVHTKAEETIPETNAEQAQRNELAMVPEVPNDLFDDILNASYTASEVLTLAERWNRLTRHTPSAEELAAIVDSIEL